MMPNHVTPADGNVFEDLGFSPGEAKNLKIRSVLMMIAEGVVEERGLTEEQAAKVLHVPPSRVSDLLHGRIGEFTVESLINMLTNAGVPVEVRASDKVA